MHVETLTNEQIAQMLPDQLREYLGRLDQAYTVATAELSEALGEQLAANTKVMQLKGDVTSLKTRMGVAQSILKSLPVL